MDALVDHLRLCEVSVQKLILEELQGIQFLEATRPLTVRAFLAYSTHASISFAALLDGNQFTTETSAVSNAQGVQLAPFPEKA